jgi:hypothetical protein
MRELRSDIAAADQHDPARQGLKLQERIACAHQIFARNAERDWTRAAGDQDMAGPQCPAFHHDRVWAGKASNTV